MWNSFYWTLPSDFRCARSTPNQYNGIEPEDLLECRIGIGVF